MNTTDPKYAIVLEDDDPEDSLIYTFSDDALWDWLKDPETAKFEAAARSGNTTGVIQSKPIPGVDYRKFHDVTFIGQAEVTRYKATALAYLMSADGTPTFEEHPALTRIKVYDQLQFEEEVEELNELLGEANVYETDL